MSLTEWENFYVIVGSSAAALTGLMFVVIALGAEARTMGDSAVLKAFATPTIVQFCMVLLLAAIISTPRHTIGSLRACILLSGLGALGYQCWSMQHMYRQKSYEPELSDWIWFVSLPVLGYATLFVAGILVGRHLQGALYVVAVDALLLLYIGIHNAWDSAVFLAAKNAQRHPSRDDSG